MDLDLDPPDNVLSDRPSVRARPHEKFQPKAKPRLGKLTRDHRAYDGVEEHTKSCSLKLNSNSFSGVVPASDDNNHVNMEVEPARTSPGNRETVVSVSVGESENPPCMDDIVLEFLLPKSVEQAGSLLFDSNPVSDIISSTHNYTLTNHDKLRPRAKARPRKATCSSADQTVSNAEMEKIPSLISVISDHTQSANCDYVGDGRQPNPLFNSDHVGCSSSMESDRNNLNQANCHEVSERLDEMMMPHHDHKVQTQAILFEHLDSSETITIDEISSPAFRLVEGVDCFSVGVDGRVLMSPTILETSSVEVPAELAEFSLLNDSNVAISENVPEVAEIEKCQESPYSDNLSRGSNPWSKQRKVAAESTHIGEQVDEEAAANSEILTTRCNFVGNMEDNDNDHEPESMSKRKRSSKKSRPDAKIDRPVRKCKRTTVAQEQPAEQSSKKFFHSTRRTKRSVDKNLLLIPEDELDYHKLKIKDIILLAEHREKYKNNTELEKSTSINQSTLNCFYGEDYGNVDDDVSEQVGGDLDDETVPQVSCNPILFTNHSFMDKPHRSRWSSKDTDLFFEAVRQFGTDLSLIQQLFPGRTRKQIRAKLKKEQIQQPFRLYEAMGSRPKDHSYFVKVIEQLQLAAAAAASAAAAENGQQNDGEVDPQMASQANGEPADPQEKEPAAAADGDETCVVENVLASPPKPNESEEDLEFWCSYDSVF